MNENFLNPILSLENMIPHHARRRAMGVLLSLSLITFVIGGVLYYIHYGHKVLGLGLIFLCFYFIFALLEAFFYSLYVKAKDDNDKSFPLSSVLYSGNKKDLVKDFANSHFGTLFFLRLGISRDDVKNEVIMKEIKPVTPDDLHTTAFDEVKDLGGYLMLLTTLSPEFANFLKERAVLERQVQGASSWVERTFDHMIQKERWWSIEGLARIPSLGRDWDYGQTGVLEKYGRFVNTVSSYDQVLYKNEVENLETILVKSRSANALIVSDTDTVRYSIIQALATKISAGVVYATLERRKVFMMDSLTLSQKADTANLFELELSKVLHEAERIGNIIFVIDNFPLFLQSAQTLGVDAMGILTPYLRSSALQCIGLADADTYFQKLQTRTDIVEHFEVVKVTIKDYASLVLTIEDQAFIMEYKYGVFYTYQAIESISEAAHKYFSSNSPSEKAIDLTLQIAPRVAKSGKKMITSADVFEMVAKETGIPTGELQGEEKEKLLNLEVLLHERIIGQNEAIIAISRALRQARSGLKKTDRPMGSFLFLGPTGVGKTETTKALSDIFFGPTTPIIRFDMSEYSGPDSLSRLIGDSGNQTAGIMATDIRKQPYGVLLLDEFEKASKEVHNLFLQVLDEGFFSDVFGKQVNTRNLIIIATSNAASDLIITLKPEEFEARKPEIINEIISRGLYKPELLNRFDGVVLFQSLDNEKLTQVAGLLFKDLQKRLTEKGVELIITQPLIDEVLKQGTDARFGARPLNRAINNLVEEKIAEGLIAGTIHGGSKVEFVSDPVQGLVIRQITKI